MLRRKCRYLVAVFLAAALLLSSGMGAYAATVTEDVDYGRKGSVNITMRYGSAKTPVAGGSLLLYRVADVVNRNGNLAYEYTEAFKNCGLSLENPNEAGLAGQFSDYIVNNGITGTEQTVGSDGKASFADLPLAVYLVRQEKTASGYDPVSPFLVGVPMLDATGEKLVYDVDASPKVELTYSGGTSGGDGGSSKSGRSSSSSGGSGGSSTTYSIDDGGTPLGSLLTELPEEEVPLAALPQTGQLNWPIPVLAVSGLLLFTYGWWLTFGRQRNEVRHG